MRKKWFHRTLAVVAAIVLVSVAYNVVLRWHWYYSVSPHLPSDASLSDLVPSGETPSPTTLENRLKRIRAHVSADGILVDAEGRRVEFRVEHAPGIKLNPEMEQRRRDEAQKKAEADAAARIRVVVYRVFLGV